MSDSGIFNSVSSVSGRAQREYMSLVDPRRILRAVAQSDAALPRGSAEDALLTWLLSVPEQIDPAEAAGTILEMSIFQPDRDGEAGRLAHLLRQVAEFPSSRLPTARRRLRHH